MKIMNSIKGKIALAIMLIGIVVLTIPALPVAASNNTENL